jgi:hypothetical protein
MTEAVVRFAREAAMFRRWALHSAEKDEVAARQALLHISALYRAALLLPPSRGPEDSGADDSFTVEHKEWKAVYAASSRLPFQYYSEIFDPLPVPPEEPVVGDLADGIADIYRDVVTGLCMYGAGKEDDALWEWDFNFAHHWGEHATAAMRAIHCYLAANSPDSLTSNV